MDNEKKHSRASWSGKWAFVLAGAGSAVGLGNMWRFPYLDAKYGGGTFLMVYLICVFTLGISLLLQDIALGRNAKKSVVGVFSRYGKKYSIIGIIAAAVPFIILPYYSIIGGWVAKYTAAYISAGPAALADGGNFFVGFIGGGLESYLWMILFAGVVMAVIFMGVKGGIERINLILMPLLILMAIGIAIFTMTIPGALDGVKYFFTPDFSKMSPELILAAIGQCFFSLSIAMAIMVTYGSYVKDEESLTGSTAQIVGFDLLVSVLAGLMIVPGAFAALGSAEAVAAKSGPGLMFITLPQVFEHMGGAAQVVGFLFFLLALFAAITSAISIAEACVSIVADGMKCSRKKAGVIISVYTLLMGCLINAGYNVLSFIQPLGEGSSLLDLADFLSNTVMMPVVCILTCLFVGFVMKPKTLVDEIRKSSEFKLAGAWTVMVKFVAPICVLVVLVAYIAMQFGLISF